MNYLAKSLLSGAAVSALASASAMGATHVGTNHIMSPNVSALHAGNFVNKSKVHDPKATKLTYTYAEYSNYVYSSDIGQSVQLLDTYWKWNSSGNICSIPKTKIKVTKQASYGTVTTGTYTESFTSCVIVFHGDNYDWGGGNAGGTDTFSSKMKSKFIYDGSKYKGTINIDATVYLE
jgi:hypothetical protein